MKILTILITTLILISLASFTNASGEITNLSYEQNLNLVAGSTQEYEIQFTYPEKNATIPNQRENSSLVLIVELNSQNPEYPVWKEDFQISGKLETRGIFSQEYNLTCYDELFTLNYPFGPVKIQNIPNGTFYCSQEELKLKTNSQNSLDLQIKPHQNLYPGNYTIKIGLYSPELCFDEDQNKAVNGLDIPGFKSKLSKILQGTADYDACYDSNYDGALNGNDIQKSISWFKEILTNGDEELKKLHFLYYSPQNQIYQLPEIFNATIKINSPEKGILDVKLVDDKNLPQHNSKNLSNFFEFKANPIEKFTLKMFYSQEEIDEKSLNENKLQIECLNNSEWEPQQTINLNVNENYIESEVTINKTTTCGIFESGVEIATIQTQTTTTNTNPQNSGGGSSNNEQELFLTNETENESNEDQTNETENEPERTENQETNEPGFFQNILNSITGAVTGSGKAKIFWPIIAVILGLTIFVHVKKKFAKNSTKKKN